MTENGSKPGASGTAKKPPTTSREDRLKAALRDNLRKRKAQARGRADDGKGPAEGEAEG